MPGGCGRKWPAIELLFAAAVPAMKITIELLFAAAVPAMKITIELLFAAAVSM